MQWLLEEQPDIARLVASGDALIGTVDTYLIYRLTDCRVYATDATNASRTLLFNIHRLTWDEDLCQWWRVPREALAEIRPSDASFGGNRPGRRAPRAGPDPWSDGRLAGCVVRPPLRAGRQQQSDAWYGCVGDDQRRHGCTAGDLGTVAALAWLRAGQPTYAAEGIINSCASTLTWLRDQLGILMSASESEDLCAQVKDDQTVYLVPAFSGLGAPYWRDSARAAIVGMSSHSDRRHIIKAALECIAFQLRDVLEMMVRDTAVRIDRIRVDGGTTSNAFLMQFIADMLGIELLVAEQSDRAALGAALMGASGLGVEPLAEGLASSTESQLSYRPTMVRAEADARYAGWRARN